MPSIQDNIPLETGKQLYVYFDHPNNAGFNDKDHNIASSWHHMMANTNKDRNQDAYIFHNTQAVLHNMAANHKQTKIRTIPSQSMIDSLEPKRKAFWQNESKKIKENNDILKDLVPYRMSGMLTKSTSTTFDDVKQEMIQTRKPEKAIQAVNVKDGLDDNTMDMIRKQIKKRKEELHGGETDTPRQQLSDDYKDSIKSALANRRRW